MGVYRIRTFSWTISYVVLISVCCAALDDCKGVDDCSCRLSNGQEINIRSLGYQGTAAPRFGYETAGAWKYAYNPCYPWSDSDSCQSVAACQEGDTDPSQKFAIGDASPATWTQEGDNYVVEYTSFGGGQIRTSVVTLKCDPSASDPTLDRFGSKPQGPSTTLYEFTLTSKCCCPGGCGSTTPTTTPKSGHTTPHGRTTSHGQPTKTPATGGISPGSVLCIIVSVLIVVYLVSGLLFMKFVRHDEGREIIPNKDIWVKLFSSIRDGFVFIFTCGKKAGYDNMK